MFIAHSFTLEVCPLGFLLLSVKRPLVRRPCHVLHRWGLSIMNRSLSFNLAFYQFPYITIGFGNCGDPCCETAFSPDFHSKFLSPSPSTWIPEKPDSCRMCWYWKGKRGCYCKVELIHFYLIIYLFLPNAFLFYKMCRVFSIWCKDHVAITTPWFMQFPQQSVGVGFWWQVLLINFWAVWKISLFVARVHPRLHFLSSSVLGVLQFHLALIAYPDWIYVHRRWLVGGLCLWMNLAIIPLGGCEREMWDVISPEFMIATNMIVLQGDNGLHGQETTLASISPACHKWEVWSCLGLSWLIELRRKIQL